jgi:hypothetical protein
MNISKDIKPITYLKSKAPDTEYFVLFMCMADFRR